MSYLRVGHMYVPSDSMSYLRVGKIRPCFFTLLTRSVGSDVTRKMGCGASRVEPQPEKASAKAPQPDKGSAKAPQPDKASAKAPPPSFAALIAAGTVVPDEHDGPYTLTA